MVSIEETIENVEKLYQAVTGRPVPPTDTVYAPIPAEKDPVEHVDEQLSRLLSAVGQSMQGAELAAEQAAWAPPLSIWENDRELLLAFDLPGVQREQVELTVLGSLLTVRGQRSAARGDLKIRASERPIGPFRRTVPLPAGVKAHEANAQLRDGLLEIRLPKESREAVAPRPIPVG